MNKYLKNEVCTWGPKKVFLNLINEIIVCQKKSKLSYYVIFGLVKFMHYSKMLTKHKVY